MIAAAHPVTDAVWRYYVPIAVGLMVVLLVGAVVAGLVSGRRERRRAGTARSSATSADIR